MTNMTDRDEFVAGAEDLARLIGRQEIAGNVIIGGSDLHSLAGLECLSAVNGSLSITSNQNLTNLGGLEGLSSIGQDLRIEFNPSLMDLKGIEKVARIDGYCSISNNPSLESLDGLVGLRSIGSYLSIIGNQSLKSLHIPSLSKIGGSVVIGHNALLKDRSGVDELVENCSCKNGMIQIENQPESAQARSLDSRSDPKPVEEPDLGGLYDHTEKALVSNAAAGGKKATLKGLAANGKDCLLELWKDPDNAMFFHVAITPPDLGESAEIKVDIMELWQKLAHLLG
jgi:hypothetical protein